MQFYRYITRLILVGVLAYCTSSIAQQRNTAQPASAVPVSVSVQGQLTVTLTVVTSVGIVIDSNGEPRLMVANAPSQADNVSWLQPAPAPIINRTLTSPVNTSTKTK